MKIYIHISKILERSQNMGLFQREAQISLDHLVQ